MRVRFLPCKYNKRKINNIMNEVEVAAVQIDIKGTDAVANLSHIGNLIEKIVAEEKIAPIVFPEVANSGHVKPMDIPSAKEYVLLAEKSQESLPRPLGNKPEGTESTSLPGCWKLILPFR